MNIDRKIDALYAELKQSQSFINQTTNLMQEALETDLSQEHNLNNIIATFEELRNRARNFIELKKTYKLLQNLRESGGLTRVR